MESESSDVDGNAKKLNDAIAYQEFSSFDGLFRP